MKKGFTLIELLVVISIIAVLLAVLVPSIGLIRIQAKNMSQSMQLRNIATGLEAFNSDNGGEYPDSKESIPDGIFGAQRLCSSMVGRDECGYSKSGNSTGIYSADFQNRDYYLDPENYTLINSKQLYGTGMNTIAGDDSLKLLVYFYPVITDVFRQKEVTIQSYNRQTVGWSNKVVYAGTPILYFKANKTNAFLNNGYLSPADPPLPIYADCAQWIYDWTQNQEFFNLPTIKTFGTTTLKYHNYFSDGVDAGKKAFYDDIINDKVTTSILPVCKDSYILISAGFDGIYGTKDDITNFDNKR
jgi:prepilin-type N-terminal cleavage/methylation domain-containing protein